MGLDGPTRWGLAAERVLPCGIRVVDYLAGNANSNPAPPMRRSFNPRQEPDGVELPPWDPVGVSRKISEMSAVPE